MRNAKILIIVVITFVFIFSPSYSAGNISYADNYQLNQTEQNNLINGIVKENNLSLGYLTLYFEDGSGSNPDSFEQLVETRNFTYDYKYITVTRDGSMVEMDLIKPGDKVFLKLDEYGYIEKLSAKSQYEPVYGSVHFIRFNNLVVKRDDGRFVSYNIWNAPIYKNNIPGNSTDILPGDKIRLMVQTNGLNIDIAFIDIEKISKPVNGIYRGQPEFFNRFSSSLSVSKVQQFINGRWESLQTKGIQSFIYNKDYKILTPSRLSGTVYFVTQKDYDGKNKIAMSSFSSNRGYEVIIDDNILDIGSAGSLQLENTSAQLLYGKDSIIIKDGRLVDISALNVLDPIIVSSVKEPFTNNHIIDVLVSETPKNIGIGIYRGRISHVDPLKTITVESFAKLGSVSWEFTNTPKTFDIDLYTSRLIESGGIGSFRDFGSEYLQQTVYIVELNDKVLLVSTAPYADEPVKGRVKSIASSGAANAGDDIEPGEELEDGDGTDAVDELTSLELVLSEARVFDDVDYLWSESHDVELSISINAIIIKNGVVGDFKSIKPGDSLTVIRHSQNKDGIIVLCQ